MICFDAPVNIKAHPSIWTTKSWTYYKHGRYNHGCAIWFYWTLYSKQQVIVWYFLAVSSEPFFYFYANSPFTFTIHSMTSLLTPPVAHSSRPSYRPKINNQPLKKFLSLVVSSDSVSWYIIQPCNHNQIAKINQILLDFAVCTIFTSSFEMKWNWSSYL